jgi:hypothetical protein
MEPRRRVSFDDCQVESFKELTELQKTEALIQQLLAEDQREQERINSY